jgi:WD40 repeat protein
MAKRALLVGVSTYNSKLEKLPSAERDVLAIKNILENPNLGEFDKVEICLSPDTQDLMSKIESLFNESNKNDLLLLYFSCHGITDANGKLYLATRSTNTEQLRSTAILSTFVHGCMADSRCQQQVIILDCCFSGAFITDLRLKHSSTTVLCSSGLLEYSKQGKEISTYTQFLIEGIQTGNADRDGDGVIAVDELSAYIEQRVQATSPDMKPFIYSVGDRIQLARSPKPQRYEDWGDAPDVPFFFGRAKELETLEQWILTDKCRLVAILGMRGIGKTSLLLGGIGKTDVSLKLTRKIQDNFEYVIWRRLLSVPPVTEILSDLIKFLSNQNELDLTSNLNDLISKLIYYLRQHRCLIILDNVESILNGGSPSRDYKDGHEGYGDLFSRIGESHHQSCLLVTSREQTKTIADLEGNQYPVRSFYLRGLDELSGRRLFAGIGIFSGSDRDWKKLIDLYNGNPLVLELTARHINATFSGNIHSFLERFQPVFDEIRDLLDWHFERLDDLEKEVVYWLAINREPVAIIELENDIVSISRKRKLASTLQLLQRHLPIERNENKFTLQPVLIEYTIERLITEIIDEIRENKIQKLQSYALIKALAKDFVRETQINVIAQPLIMELKELFGTPKIIEFQLLEVLAKLREELAEKVGYAAGNVANLLCCLGANLSNLDFSHLVVRQAYLKNVNLLNVNFSYADLDTCAFAEDFTYMNSVAFSPESEFLETGDNSGEIRLWRLADSDQILCLREHTDWVQSVAFSPDAKSLVSSSGDTTLKIWDIADITNIRCTQTLRGHGGYVSSGRFSPDGKLIASSCDDRTLKIWDVETGECIQTLQGHTGSVMSVRFSPDGEYVVSGSRDTTVRIWNVYTGECLKILNGHTELIMSVAWNPDGDLVASASEDLTIKIWNVNQDKCLHTLHGHRNWVWAVAFSPDGNLIASGSVDSTLKLWDVKTGQYKRTFQGHQSRIWSIAFNSEGTLLASASDDVTVRLWDVNTGGCLRTLRGYANPISSVAFSPDGQTLASSNGDLTLKLWNVQTGYFKTLTGQKQGGGGIAFSPDGKSLVSCDAESLKLWDVETGSLRREFKGHKAITESVIFSPHGRTLASSSCDHTVRIWDIATGQSRIFDSHTDWVWSVAFSSNGQLLASGSDDRQVIVWNVQTGQPQHIFLGHTSRVRSVIFNPYYSQILASCGDDKKVKLWDIQTGECLKTFVGHEGEILSISFSPDGQTLASGGNDSNVKLWNIQTGEGFKTFIGHRGSIRCVTFSPNGWLLASSTASGDQSIRIWDIQSGECLKSFINPRPYEGMNITGVKGLTVAQKETLRSLGAVEDRL